MASILQNVATNAANAAIGAAASTLLSEVNSTLSSLFGSVFGSWGWSGEVEDFNALKEISKKAIRTSYQPDWLFKLVVPGSPSDFDFYVKDISYSLFDFQNDEEQYGAATYAWPRSASTLKLTMNVRDNTDRRVATFLRTWANQVVHKDGTVGLPYGVNGYVRNVSIYMLSPAGTETLDCTMEMYPLQCGDASMSRDNGQFKELPVTFVQFTNLENSISTTSTSGDASTSTTTSSTTSTSTSSTSTSSTTSTTTGSGTSTSTSTT